MISIVSLFVALTLQAEKPKQAGVPSWAYHSKISPAERVRAVIALELRINKLAKTNPKARKADDLLRKESCIVEPLGEDASGADAFRIIGTAKKRGSFLGILATYPSDGQKSKMLKEFIDTKPFALAGIAPVTPIVLIRMDKPIKDTDLPLLVSAINTRGESQHSPS